jgi:FSR family fosmidomycin resistance protein-like MFS transporter
VEVGVLLSAPNLLGNLVEPAVGVLGDAWDRRALVRAGGVAFAAALLLVALGDGFLPLLAALALLSPASGAFVGLSQATLMDVDPGARERNMARWALAGSLGMVGGPLVVGAATALGVGWRTTFALLAVPAVLALFAISGSWPAGSWPARSWPAGTPHHGRHDTATGGRPPLGAALARGARDVAAALGRGEVLRWLILLELADLLLDVLHAYLALYFMDVVGTGGAGAGIAVAVWTGVGLLGDALLIPLLARVSGIRYLRASALAVLVAFPSFMLVQGIGAKLALLALLGLLNAGWYAILKGRLYAAMPGRSATVMAVGNVFGLAGSLLPLTIGLVADRIGLAGAMWLLLLAPVALLVGLPRRPAGE